MTKLYAEIAKMETQDDDTVKVWGYASSEEIDSDGEVIATAAMKAAIPDYMKFARGARCTAQTLRERQLKSTLKTTA